MSDVKRDWESQAAALQLSNLLYPPTAYTPKVISHDKARFLWCDIMSHCRACSL